MHVSAEHFLPLLGHRLLIFNLTYELTLNLIGFKQFDSDKNFIGAIKASRGYRILTEQVEMADNDRGMLQLLKAYKLETAKQKQQLLRRRLAVFKRKHQISAGLMAEKASEYDAKVEVHE